MFFKNFVYFFFIHIFTSPLFSFRLCSPRTRNHTLSRNNNHRNISHRRSTRICNTLSVLLLCTTTFRFRYHPFSLHLQNLLPIVFHYYRNKYYHFGRRITSQYLYINYTIFIRICQVFLRSFYEFI